MAGDPEQRKSRPERRELVTDLDEVARIEAENGLRQTKLVIDIIDEQLRENTQFFLRPSLVSKLNRLAIEGLSELPGSYRPGPMSITHSDHNPPAPGEVQEFVEQMCDYVNDNWDRDAWHLAAYLMWRLNWIHPYEDGNGRTSRAISYLVLCIKLGLRLPGTRTIPEVIAENKDPYYTALDEADAAAKRDKIDVTAMERVLKDALADQLADFGNKVTGGHLSGKLHLKGGKDNRAKLRWTSKLHEHYNRYPFWYWGAGVLLAIILVLV